MPSQGKDNFNLQCASMKNYKVTNIKVYFQKEGEARPADLETIFFDFEVSHFNHRHFLKQNYSSWKKELFATIQTFSGKKYFQVGMEGEVCRDQVCLDSEAETQYLQVMSHHHFVDIQTLPNPIPIPLIAPQCFWMIFNPCFGNSFHKYFRYRCWTFQLGLYWYFDWKYPHAGPLWNAVLPDITKGWIWHRSSSQINSTLCFSNNYNIVAVSVCLFCLFVCLCGAVEQRHASLQYPMK